jgi:hypothetical protein
MAERKKDTRKKTGKAMPPPEDAKDVNVKPGSPAAENLTLQSEGEPTQQTLLEDAGADVAPDITAEVKDDMVLMSFVKTTLHKERNTDFRFVCLHLSAIIGDNAADRFTDKVSGRYRKMTDDAGITELSVDDCPTQFLEIFRAEDGKEMLREPVILNRVRLEVKEVTGSGEAVKGIRLSFVAPIKLHDKVLNWAARSFGTLVFVRMGDQSGKLIK